ncbi:MAG: hypothetical protein ACE5IZ_11510 [Dehalococcoidia bacterium]
MLTFIEQQSTPPDAQGRTPKVWVDFTPELNGLALAIPAWTLYYAGKSLNLPVTLITLTAHPTVATTIRLYVVPTFDGTDNYHLDEVVQDGINQPAAAEAFPEIGHMLLVWGTVPAGGTEAQLFYLKHVVE